MAEPILKVHGLIAGYGAISAIKEINFDAYPGEIVGLVGPNGAGKTTFLETLAGTMSPKAGEIYLMGQRINDLPELERRKMGLLLVPQEAYTFPLMSVKGNLEISGLFNSLAKNRELIRYVYELFPVLKERSNQLARTLSGGQQKMLAVGMGIIADAKLLLLDEPSIGLAPKLVTRLFELFKKIKDDTGKTLILAEQNVKILNIADRVFGLEAGEIRFCQKTEDLEPKVVRSLFLGE